MRWTTWFRRIEDRKCNRDKSDKLDYQPVNDGPSTDFVTDRKWWT